MNLFGRIFGMARKTEAPGPGDATTLFSRWITGPTAAKIRVTEETALTYSAVYRAISLISQIIGYLPWHVYERVGDAREPRPEHRIDRLLEIQPNPEMTSQVFRETLQAHVLGWGNGYAEIERDRLGDVLALWPIEPHRVTPKRDANSKLYYEIQGIKGGAKTVLEPAAVFHLRGLGYDGLVGYSPIHMAKESIGLGMALEKFGSAFFGNGTRLSGVIESPISLKDESKKAMSEGWQRMYSGTDNAGKVAIMDGGATFKQISVAPEEAQFLESRKFQVTEVARWFGVPPHKLAELSNAHFNNIEHQAQEFVTDSLLHWVRRWEDEARLKLFGKEESRLFTRMNLNGLLRGDSQSRGEYYKTMLQNGVFSINDVRALEDMNSIGADGDLRFVPLNMVTLENARSNMPRNTDGGDDAGA